jgi:hypothetical protein
VTGVQEQLDVQAATGKVRAPEPQDARTTTAILQLASRIQGEYREMPGLSLTADQAQRFWCLDQQTCATVLSLLIDHDVVRRTADGKYVRTWC